MRAPFVLCILAAACGPELLDGPDPSLAHRTDAVGGGTKYFQTLTPMAHARTAASAVVTCNGVVMIIGGEDTAARADSELYNPFTNSWSTGATLAVPRSGFVARVSTACNVGAIGGITDAGTPTANYELQLRGDGHYTDGGTLLIARGNFTATETPDHRFVLTNGQALQTETLDLSAQTSVLTGSLLNIVADPAEVALPTGEIVTLGGAVWSHLPPDGGGATVVPAPGLQGGSTLTLLATGDVVSAGGVNAAGPTGETFRMHPDGGLQGMGPLNKPRFDHGASVLPMGTLWVMGGTGDAGELGDSEEQSSGTWSPGPVGLPRSSHVQVVLPEGQVLVAGGTKAGSALSSAQVYDETMTAITTLPTPVTRSGACGTMLWDGRFLRAGGGVAGAELFDPSTRLWTPLPAPHTTRGNCAAIALHDTRVLLVGGSTIASELYDFTLGMWVDVGPLSVARDKPSAVLLPSGEVLVAGGYDVTGKAMLSAETFEPASLTFRSAGMMSVGRSEFPFVRLTDDTVLAVGGSGTSVGLGRVEVDRFDPVQRKWSADRPLTVARFGHTATLLSGGEVEVVGGAQAGSAQLERLNANRTQWSVSNALNTTLSEHVALRLPFNRVLVAGGTGTTSIYAQKWDPYSPALIEGVSLPVTVGPALGALLPDGTVLLVGDTTAVLYDEGRVGVGVARPVVNPVASVPAASPLTVGGAGFYGPMTASGGTTRASPSNVPLLLLRHEVTGQVRPVSTYTFGAPDSIELSLAGDFAPGWYVATTVLNGVPSNPRTLFISHRCAADGDCSGAYCGKDMLCCARPCNGTCITGTCTGEPDAGVPDAGVFVDAGMFDAGVIDAGEVDSGTPDSGVVDAGEPDTGAPDAGVRVLPPLKLGTGFGCSTSSGAALWLLLLVAERRLKRRRRPQL